ARADQEIGLALEQKDQRERAAQPRQRRLDRLSRRAAFAHLVRYQMGDHLGVGLRCKLGTILFELLAELAEVLDDAVVYDREPFGRMRMRIRLARPPMCRPAGMTDADRAAQRLALELLLEVAQLALRAPPLERGAFERGYASRIVAAIFQTFERVDEMFCDGLTTENADNAAHGRRPYLVPDESCLGELCTPAEQKIGNQHPCRPCNMM